MTTKDKGLNVKLLSYTQEPELMIAAAGKLCYSASTIEDLLEKQTPESVEKFVNMLTSMGHESPLEHVSFNFGVEGISRIVEIQLVRHRIASYSIQSGRYVKRENPEFIKPEKIKNNFVASKIFDDIAEASSKAYNELFLVLMLEQMGYSADGINILNSDERADKVYRFFEEDKKLYKQYEKIAIEDARYAHLQSIGVKVVCTFNLRSLINFTRHRECRRAQNEIQELTKAMIKIIRDKFPLLGNILGAPCRFGVCPEGKMSCKNPYPKIKKAV